MRSETDTFKQHDDENFYCNAEIEDGDVLIACVDGWDATYALLTKQQAAEFARQILEMVGDGDK